MPSVKLTCHSFLIDHDVTSNYCNWMYVAGVGNDLREDRYFNVVKQGHTYGEWHDMSI